MEIMLLSPFIIAGICLLGARIKDYPLRHYLENYSRYTAAEMLSERTQM